MKVISQLFLLVLFFHNNFISAKTSVNLLIQPMPLLAQTHTGHDGQSGFQHEHQEKYTETPLRRGELVFFVSLPFMLATHMLAGSLLYLGVSGESSLNTMHPGYVGVLLASSVYFSLAIAIHDYQTVKLKTPASAENARDARFVSVSFRF